MNRKDQIRTTFSLLFADESRSFTIDAMLNHEKNIHRGTLFFINNENDNLLYFAIYQIA
jgi:hypothetical protein